MVDFATIPGGSVTLTDARRGHTRTVELLPFEIATAPVSADEFAAGRSLSALGGLPASALRWLDAVLWCNAASDSEGLMRAYKTDGGVVRWVPAAEGYRLPTEAEWVHAACGRTIGPRYGALSEIAWSAADEIDGPQPVAGKAPNAYGLYDMFGNVWEWCWDRLDPARYGDYRLIKGGGWADPGWSCRVGVRRGNAPDAVVEDAGLRPVRGALLGLDGGQGWSEAADRLRASLPYPLPVGWTPLRAEEMSVSSRPDAVGHERS